MSDIYGLTAENLLRILPEVLRQDESMAALAASIADVLAARPAEVERLLIYPAIDRLPEDLLDILAYDFKVDWWDGNYSLEEKRNTLKGNWAVHRCLGTVGAVKTAIEAIYPATQVTEWWEYGGEPYHFKLTIDITYSPVDPEKHRRVMERVGFYKNLRSHLDAVEYYDIGGKAAVWLLGAGPGEYIEDSGKAVYHQQAIPAVLYASALRAGDTLADGATAILY